MIVGAVVVAAGKSERMDQNRMLLPLNGKPIIENILDSLEAAGVTQRILVLGGDIEPVVEAVRPKLGKVKIALNVAPEQGLTSSFQTGLIVISNLEAAFLVLGDQPILEPKFLAAMVKTMEDNPQALIVSPVYEGKKGFPLLFRRQLFGEILSLTRAQTIDDLVRSHENSVVTVEAPAWTVIDVETPERC
jgi:molybdenum cofactor cytidylyltransferase